MNLRYRMYTMLFFHHDPSGSAPYRKTAGIRQKHSLFNIRLHRMLKDLSERTEVPADVETKLFARLGLLNSHPQDLRARKSGLVTFALLPFGKSLRKNKHR